MAKTINQAISEREYLSKLRTFFRKCVRKGFHENYHGINFLSILEHVGPCTELADRMTEKYFGLYPCGYDFFNGNSLLQGKIKEWYAELNIIPPKFIFGVNINKIKNNI